MLLVKYPYTHSECRGQQGSPQCCLCSFLPGKTLHLSALIVARKFRDRGNKQGALEAMKLLADSGLGELTFLNSARGTDKVILFTPAKYTLRDIIACRH